VIACSPGTVQKLQRVIFSGGYEGKDLNGIESGMKAVSAPPPDLLF
jgi:hypothetical protein